MLDKLKMLDKLSRAIASKSEGISLFSGSSILILSNDIMARSCQAKAEYRGFKM